MFPTRIHINLRWSWFLAGSLLAGLRVAGVQAIWFQAVAHLLVGGWLGAWAVGLSLRYQTGIETRTAFYGWLALALTLVEIGAFLAGLDGH